jgi:pyruvate dehydrogenase E2 component (dihydrolipoamide acetyltransferase)
MGKYLFTIDDEPFEVEVLGVSGFKAEVAVNGQVISVDIAQCPASHGACSAASAPQTSQTAPAAPAAAPKEEVKAEKPAHKAGSGVAKANITAPLPGIVRNIGVRIGDKVGFGDTVLMIEAMKMENSINATDSGTVIDICCNIGDAVKEGDLIIVLGD